MDNKVIDNVEKKFLCPDKDYWSLEYFIRNIDFMDEFNDDTARSFITKVRAFAKELTKEPAEVNKDIYVYVNSQGGYVTSLLAMVDAMSLVPNDFVTIGIGQCASCGAVFLSCGKKGKRYITENARVLIHQVSSGMWGKTSEIQASAKETERLNKLLLGMLAKNCGKTLEELEQLTLGGDLVLNAEQAVEFGIVDAILTQDVVKRLAQTGKEIELEAPEEQQEKDITEITKEIKSKENYETTSLNLEIKGITEDNEYYYITGLASTPDVDRVNDIIDPDALMNSVNNMGLPAFIHQHNLRDMPLGVCERVYKSGDNTMVDLKMPKDEDSKKIKDRIAMGAYQGLSIGYVATDTERTAEGYRVIKALDWYEVSLVTVPANPNAKILQVKTKMHENIECDIMQDIKTVRDVENLLVSVGCTKKEAGYLISLVKSSKGEPKDEKKEGEPQKQDETDMQALVELRNALTKK